MAWQHDCCSQLQCFQLVDVTLYCPPWKIHPTPAMRPFLKILWPLVTNDTDGCSYNFCSIKMKTTLQVHVRRNGEVESWNIVHTKLCHGSVWLSDLYAVTVACVQYFTYIIFFKNNLPCFVVHVPIHCKSIFYSIHYNSKLLISVNCWFATASGRIVLLPFSLLAVEFHLRWYSAWQASCSQARLLHSVAEVTTMITIQTCESQFT